MANPPFACTARKYGIRCTRRPRQNPTGLPERWLMHAMTCYSLRRLAAIRLNSCRRLAERAGWSDDQMTSLRDLSTLALTFTQHLLLLGRVRRGPL